MNYIRLHKILKYVTLCWVTVYVVCNGGCISEHVKIIECVC